MLQNFVVTPALFCVVIGTQLAHTNAVAVAIGGENEHLIGRIILHFKCSGTDLGLEQRFSNDTSFDLTAQYFDLVYVEAGPGAVATEPFCWVTASTPPRWSISAA